MRSGGSTERGLRPLHMFMVLFKNSLSVSKGNKFSIGKLQNMYTWVSKCMAVEYFSQLMKNKKNTLAWPSVRVRSARMKLLLTNDC